MEHTDAPLWRTKLMSNYMEIICFNNHICANGFFVVPLQTKWRAEWRTTY